MIHPEIRVTDLDPWEWTSLGEVLRRTAPPPARTVSALLERGRLVRLVDSAKGVLPAGRHAGGPKAFAERLLKSTKADRVIVAERSALEEFQRLASSRDGRDMAVLDWLAWRERLFREKFVSRIVVLPPLPVDAGPASYPRVKAFVSQSREGSLVAAAYDGDRRFVTGVFRVAEKRIVALSTFDAIAADGPFPKPSDFPAALKAAAARFGTVQAAVRVTRAVLENVLAGAPIKVLAESLKKGESWGQGAKPDGYAALLGIFRFVGPGSPSSLFPILAPQPP